MIVSVVSRHIKRVTFHDGGFKILPHIAKKTPSKSRRFPFQINVSINSGKYKLDAFCSNIKHKRTFSQTLKELFLLDSFIIPK